jgi:general secretion pathway protein N
MNRRRVALYAVGGIALYLVFLVVSAPAGWVAWALARSEQKAVALAHPNGTVWRGEADLYAGGPTNTQHLGRVRWRILPLRALLGRIALDIGIGDGAMQAHLVVQRSTGRLTIEDLSATLPAHLAGLFYAPALFFAPTGTLELRGEKLSLTRDAVAGQAQALWRGAGGRFTGSTSLGDYRVDLNGQGERATIRLSTARGDLGLNGQGEWRVAGNGDLRFAGSAQPQGDAARVEPLLRALGPDRGGGRRDLRLNTRLPLAQLLGL